MPRDPFDVDRPHTVGPARLLAYVDESIRKVDETVSVYILAAAVVNERRGDTVRTALGQLVRKGQGQLHWRDERPSHRMRIVETIRSTEISMVVTVGAMVQSRRQERARRVLLRRLLWKLDRLQVTEVVLESRHSERDRHDVTAIGAFRRENALSRRLVVTHGLPVQEPLLWIADAAAGAVGDHWCGDGRCLDVIADLVEITDLGEII